MVNVAEFRKMFPTFLGNDRFTKFVRQLHRADRLRYWQEEVCGQFIAAHPEFSCSVEELREALQICELHDCELQLDEVEIFHGCLDYANCYIKARAALFPNAATGPVSTEGHPFDGHTARVWYCAECRAAETAWRGRRA